jgi:hypothetical protein
MPLFAVIRRRGTAWQPDLDLEGQSHWREHADFMNRLAEKGIVVLGGPLEGTPDVLLVMRADSKESIRQQLDHDPWTGLKLLQIRSTAPWTLRLGALPVAP